MIWREACGEALAGGIPGAPYSEGSLFRLGSAHPNTSFPYHICPVLAFQLVVASAPLVELTPAVVEENGAAPVSKVFLTNVAPSHSTSSRYPAAIMTLSPRTAPRFGDSRLRRLQRGTVQGKKVQHHIAGVHLPDASAASSSSEKAGISLWSQARDFSSLPTRSSILWRLRRKTAWVRSSPRRTQGKKNNNLPGYDALRETCPLGLVFLCGLHCLADFSCPLSRPLSPPLSLSLSLFLLLSFPPSRVSRRCCDRLPCVSPSAMTEAALLDRPHFTHVQRVSRSASVFRKRQPAAIRTAADVEIESRRG